MGTKCIPSDAPLRDVHFSYLHFFNWSYSFRAIGEKLFSSHSNWLKIRHFFSCVLGKLLYYQNYTVYEPEIKAAGLPSHSSKIWHTLGWNMYFRFMAQNLNVLKTADFYKSFKFDATLWKNKNEFLLSGRGFFKQ